MKTTYCATAFMDGDWVSDEVIDDLLSEEIVTNFANIATPMTFYREGEHIMVKWKSNILLPPDQYYVDMELKGKANLENVLVKVTSIPRLLISTEHADSEAKKIRRYYGNTSR